MGGRLDFIHLTSPGEKHEVWHGQNFVKELFFSWYTMDYVGQDGAKPSSRTQGGREEESTEYPHALSDMHCIVVASWIIMSAVSWGQKDTPGKDPFNSAATLVFHLEGDYSCTSKTSFLIHIR